MASHELPKSDISSQDIEALPGTHPRPSRREFLRMAGGAVLGVLVAGGKVGSAQAEPADPQPQAVPEVSSLTNLSEKINQLVFTDVSPELSASVKELAEKFTERAERRFQRIEKLTELAEQKPEGSPSSPSLTELYRQSLGAIDSIPLKKIVPFLQDKTKLEGIIISIQNQVEAILTAPQQNNSAENRLKTLEMSLTRQLADRLFLFAEDYQNKPDVEIKSHQDIDMSDEGKEKFKQHQKVINAYLQKHPNAKKLVDTISIHSASYGYQTQEPPEGIGGLFKVAFVGVNKPIIQLELFLNHLPGEKDIEAILDHEMMGHGTDLEINRLFADQLSEKEEIELLRLKYLSLLNPYCSPVLTDIPSLFNFSLQEFSPSGDDSMDGSSDGGNVENETEKEAVATFNSNNHSSSSFVDIIKNYPIMATLMGYVQKVKERKSLLQEATTSSSRTGSNVLVPTNTDKLRDQPFIGLKDFVKEYLPILKEEASTGRIDSKLIGWALENFPEQFSKYDFLWDLSTKDGKKYTPQQGDKGEIWINYCQLVVSNAALIHGLFNGTPEIRGIITGTARELLEEKVFQRVRGARNEVYAEGMAKSGQIGEEVKGTTYKDATHQVSLFLSQAA